MFPGHGEFEGIVVYCNDDDVKPGYRIFRVHYFEDPEDGEDFWPSELYDVLMAEDVVADRDARLKYDKTERAKQFPGAWTTAHVSSSADVNEPSASANTNTFVVCGTNK